MSTRKTCIGMTALGAIVVLIAGVASAAETRPPRPEQPSGSVRYARKRVTRSPGAAGADRSTRQRQGRTEAARQPHAAPQDAAPRERTTPPDRAPQRLVRTPAADRRPAAARENDRRSGDRDDTGDSGRHNRADDRGWRHGERDRSGSQEVFPAIRRTHVAGREFHHGADAVRVYGKRPLYGRTFLHLPDRCEVVHVGGRKYFVHDDVYYVERPLVGGVRYVVVPPPVGVHIRCLPAAAIAIQIGGFSFYYCDDTYYRVEYVNDAPQYVVSEVPIGGSIVELPAGNEPVVVREVTYYRVGRFFYRPYFQEGRVIYVRVAAP